MLTEPRRIELRPWRWTRPAPDDIVVEIRHSGISTGTEKLFWTGRMPPFPGMGYPLVPGYEAVGEVVEGRGTASAPASRVFVPGANCFGPVRGLFGGSARRLICPRRPRDPHRRRASAPTAS